MERKDNGGTRNALETCLTPSNCKNCDRSVKTAGGDGSAVVEVEGNGSHGCPTKENSTYPQAMQEKLYLQNMLYEGLGPVIVADFREWKWKWVLDKQKELGASGDTPCLPNIHVSFEFVFVATLPLPEQLI